MLDDDDNLFSKDLFDSAFWRRYGRVELVGREVMKNTQRLRGLKNVENERPVGVISKVNDEGKDKRVAEQGNSDSAFLSDQNLFWPNNNHHHTAKRAKNSPRPGDKTAYNWCRVLKPVSIRLRGPDASAVAVQ